MPTYETANEFLHPTYLEMYNSSACFMWLFSKQFKDMYGVKSWAMDIFIQGRLLSGVHDLPQTKLLVIECVYQLATMK